MVKLKRSIFLIIFIWSACPSLGQVVLTPKNADGLYKAGEKAVWTVKPAPQSSTISVTYTARKNGTGSPFKQGTLALSSGGVTIELTLDEPGAITLNVTLQAAPATTAGNGFELRAGSVPPVMTSSISSTVNPLL
jgi:hypothetical protein